jgi:hypothetical protein
VVVPVANRREFLLAKVAFVRTLACVDSLVNLQVASLVEDLVAQDWLSGLFVHLYNFIAGELFLLLFLYY